MRLAGDLAGEPRQPRRRPGRLRERPDTAQEPALAPAVRGNHFGLLSPVIFLTNSNFQTALAQNRPFRRAVHSSGCVFYRRIEASGGKA